MTGKPGRGKPVDERDLVGRRDRAASFCRPSRGPTSTSVTRDGSRGRTGRATRQAPSRSTSATPGCTRLPSAQRTALTTASCGRTQRQLHLHGFEQHERFAACGPAGPATTRIRTTVAGIGAPSDSAPPPPRPPGAPGWPVVRSRPEDLAVEEHPARLAGVHGPGQGRGGRPPTASPARVRVLHRELPHRARRRVRPLRGTVTRTVARQGPPRTVRPSDSREHARADARLRSSPVRQ